MCRTLGGKQPLQETHGLLLVNPQASAGKPHAASDLLELVGDDVHTASKRTLFGNNVHFRQLHATCIDLHTGTVAPCLPTTLTLSIKVVSVLACRVLPVLCDPVAHGVGLVAWLACVAPSWYVHARLQLSP